MKEEQNNAIERKERNGKERALSYIRNSFLGQYIIMALLLNSTKHFFILNSYFSVNTMN